MDNQEERSTQSTPPGEVDLTHEHYGHTHRLMYMPFVTSNLDSIMANQARDESAKEAAKTVAARNIQARASSKGSKDDNNQVAEDASRYKFGYNPYSYKDPLFLPSDKDVAVYAIPPSVNLNSVYIKTKDELFSYDVQLAKQFREFDINEHVLARVSHIATSEGSAENPFDFKKHFEHVCVDVVNYILHNPIFDMQLLLFCEDYIFTNPYKPAPLNSLNKKMEDARRDNPNNPNLPTEDCIMPITYYLGAVRKFITETAWKAITKHTGVKFTGQAADLTGKRVRQNPNRMLDRNSDSFIKYPPHDALYVTLLNDGCMLAMLTCFINLMTSVAIFKVSGYNVYTHTKWLTAAGMKYVGKSRKKVKGEGDDEEEEEEEDESSDLQQVVESAAKRTRTAETVATLGRVQGQSKPGAADVAPKAGQPKPIAAAQGRGKQGQPKPDAAAPKPPPVRRTNSIVKTANTRLGKEAMQKTASGADYL